MNTSAFRRELIAQAVIVFAICAGGWFIFVQPRESEAHRIQETLRAVDPGTGASSESIHNAGFDELATVRASLRAIDDASFVAADHTRLYQLIVRVARESRVDVRSVTPIATGGEATDDADVRTIRTEAMVDGAYEDIAAFIGDMGRKARSVRVVRMTISPLSHTATPRIAATITFDAHAFSVPEVLRTVAESKSARRTGMEDGD